MRGFLSARLPMRITASMTIASTAALSPNSKAVKLAPAPKARKRSSTPYADDAGKYEQPPGNKTAYGPMHEPANVSGKLLRLGAGQQHAVVQCMEKPLLGNPPLLLDEDAMMMAICPAGPPKLRSATLTQVRVASLTSDTARARLGCSEGLPSQPHSSGPRLVCKVNDASSAASRHER